MSTNPKRDEAAVRERPILFSGAMVRAILDGRKTVTRRVVRPQPARQLGREAGDVYVSGHDDYPITVNVPVRGGYRPAPLRCPYGAPGDLLWVRETWAPHDEETIETQARDEIYYRADDGLSVGGFTRTKVTCTWRPSIHMPRWASRITLEVTGVRVERLKEITEEEARAEGVEHSLGPQPTPPDPRSYREAFIALWDRINGDRAPWSANPWVWVVHFRRVEP